MALMTASRKATLFHKGVSIRSIGVMVAATLFSISSFDNTLLVALIREQYPYSLFSTKSQRSRLEYFATLIELPFSSAYRYAT